jgi:hypothetical protein
MNAGCSGWNAAEVSRHVGLHPEESLDFLGNADSVFVGESAVEHTKERKRVELPDQESLAGFVLVLQRSDGQAIGSRTIKNVDDLLLPPTVVDEMSCQLRVERLPRECAS